MWACQVYENILNAMKELIFGTFYLLHETTVDLLFFSNFGNQFVV